jgi:DNA polymerase
MDRAAYRFKWTTCNKCILHRTAKNHVLYRVGEQSPPFPASVLFLGEAPGKTENILGKPFVGRAGHLLNDIIEQLKITSYVIANTTCCIPWKDNDPTTDEIRQPTPEEISACSPHLTELAQMAKPKLIVALGKVAKENCPPSMFKFTLPKVPYLPLVHPAFLLRTGGLGSYNGKQLLITLQQALVEVGLLDKPHLFQDNPLPRKTIVK